MREKTRPAVLITMGDGAGIGPEIIVKALANADIYTHCRPLVIGAACIIKRAISITGSRLHLHICHNFAEGIFEAGTIDCVDMDLLPENLAFGQVSAVAGHAAYCFIEKAVQMVQAGEGDVICTAPLNKQALHLGGHNFPGHTEILAKLTGTKQFSMMFASSQLNVILVTIHEGLIEAIQNITPEKVYSTISLADQVLQRHLKRHPRIAVCGINPHAGEHGLFGNGEEEKKILPAIEKAKNETMDVSGPLPADTAFYLARRGDYDIVVSMYHDQGLGPVKVLGIEHSVNITVGLPFIRTSVDHGTAFNIAGKNLADAGNMEEAIRQAWLLCGETDEGTAEGK